MAWLDVAWGLLQVLEANVPQGPLLSGFDANQYWG